LSNSQSVEFKIQYNTLTNVQYMLRNLPSTSALVQEMRKTVSMCMRAAQWLSTISLSYLAVNDWDDKYVLNQFRAQPWMPYQGKWWVSKSFYASGVKKAAELWDMQWKRHTGIGFVAYVEPAVIVVKRLNVIAIIASKMASHSAGTVRMREESESGIRKK